MDALINFSDKLLSMIPFNGDKTIMGAGLKLMLPIAVAHFPFLIVIAPYLDGTADFLLSTGLVHKFVKKVN